MSTMEETYKIRPTHSIGFRISLLVSLAIMIFGTLAICFVIVNQNRMYKNEKFRQWKIFVDTVTPNLKNMLASNNLGGITHLLDKLTTENEEIHHAYLIDEEENIVYSTDIKYKDDKLPVKERKLVSTNYRKDSTSGVQVYQNSIKIRTGSTTLGTFFIGFNYLPSFEKERLISILMLENAIQGAIKKYLIELDFYQVDFITKDMMKGVEDVAYFKVVSIDGTIVSSNKKSETLKPLKDKDDLEILSALNIRKPIWTRKLKLKKKSILEVTLSTFNDKTPVGMIQVGYDMSSLNAALIRARIVLVIITIVSITLAIRIAMYIASRISNPAVHLVNIAREIGGGNLDVQSFVDSGGDEMRLLGRAFNQMIKGLKERNMIKDTFSRYVSKQVAEELLKNPEKLSLGGEYKEVTILFSDIRGFTAISERLPAEEVVEILNEYFNLMVDVVFEYEGTLDKYIGDALMVVFGSPTTHKDDPLRAVKTALKMRDKLELLNKKWMERDNLPPINIGIGINTGKVIAGNIGHLQRMEYTVIGDNVNLASRIEGLTKEYNCHIIVADSTYKRVQDKVEVRKLGFAAVKGKTQSVEIYELINFK